MRFPWSLPPLLRAFPQATSFLTRSLRNSASIYYLFQIHQLPLELCRNDLFFVPGISTLQCKQFPVWLAPSTTGLREPVKIRRNALLISLHARPIKARSVLSTIVLFASSVDVILASPLPQDFQMPPPLFPSRAKCSTRSSSRLLTQPDTSSTTRSLCTSALSVARPSSPFLLRPILPSLPAHQPHRLMMWTLAWTLVDLARKSQRYVASTEILKTTRLLACVSPGGKNWEGLWICVAVPSSTSANARS